MFDYVGDAPVVLDARVEDAAHEGVSRRSPTIMQRARPPTTRDPAKANYRPLKPDRLYLEARRNGAARLTAGAAAPHGALSRSTPGARTS